MGALRRCFLPAVAVSRVLLAFARLGYRDVECTTIVLAVIQIENGILCLFLRIHLDKAESARPAGVTIRSHFRRNHLATGGENSAELTIGSAESEVSDEYFIVLHLEWTL